MSIDYRSRIRSIAKKREIQLLLHFTQAANLPGIVEHGILPRREIEKDMYMAYASDKYRLDESLDAVSVSISRINEVMFEAKRRKSEHDDWLVLVLSSEILWTHSCKFCWRNAARNEIRSHRGRRDGPWALDMMFSRRVGAENELPMNYPTDPEAEVQVFDAIAPKYIKGAIVNHSGVVDPVQRALKGLLGDSPLVVVNEF